jgi:hypothetical protein
MNELPLRVRQSGTHLDAVDLVMIGLPRASAPVNLGEVLTGGIGLGEDLSALGALTIIWGLDRPA